MFKNVKKFIIDLQIKKGINRYELICRNSLSEMDLIAILNAQSIYLWANTNQSIKNQYETNINTK